MIEKAFIYLIVVLTFNACAIVPKHSATKRPTLKDYEIGEKWTWKYKMIAEGEIRSEGQVSREVVDCNGDLAFDDGNDTLKISTIVDQKPSKTPKYDWPLQVGKKWRYKYNWGINDGTKGESSQDVVVASFNEVAVAAGKFMAYKIEYKGRVTNSRGYDAIWEDIWWYAPAIKTFIKHTQDDGSGLYVKELINYTKAQQ